MDPTQVFQQVSSEYCSKEQLAIQQSIENILGEILDTSRNDRTIGYLIVPKLTPEMAEHFQKAGFTVEHRTVPNPKYTEFIKKNFIPSSGYKIPDEYIIRTKISWIPSAPK